MLSTLAITIHNLQHHLFVQCMDMSALQQGM